MQELTDKKYALYSVLLHLSEELIQVVASDRLVSQDLNKTLQKQVSYRAKRFIKQNTANPQGAELMKYLKAQVQMIAQRLISCKDFEEMEEVLAYLQHLVDGGIMVAPDDLDPEKHGLKPLESVKLRN